MKDHSVPIVVLQLGPNVSCHIIVDFGEILMGEPSVLAKYFVGWGRD